jgi:hypothetical protein
MDKNLIMQTIIVAVLIIVIFFILFFNKPAPKGSVTLEEINSARQQLMQVTDSNDDESARIAKLEKLAKMVGAGTIDTKIIGSDRNRMLQNTISEAELVQNINQALQTHMLFDSCSTANKQYKIAVFATIIAIVSVFITWNISKKEAKESKN